MIEDLDPSFPLNTQPKVALNVSPDDGSIKNRAHWQRIKVVRTSAI